LIGWPQLRISGHADATHSSPPARQWSALMSVTHRDDAVDGGPCIGLHLNNRPLLSLLLAKFASSTSPQKPPATYTQVNDFGPHTDSIFRGATYTRGRLICEYIRYHKISNIMRTILALILFLIFNFGLKLGCALYMWKMFFTITTSLPLHHYANKSYWTASTNTKKTRH